MKITYGLVIDEDREHNHDADADGSLRRQETADALQAKNSEEYL